ncbi:glycosyltransferase family 4 protein [Methanoculleus sp. Afa-1]|uniref:Glycosyltransferase family 4 protein n=1 Tax=Methanoculleus formosensis TaxID=2590886 RepID=A0A9E4ZIM3_9EURY|nr:glycosyltransferase family 4 protein [Methanoculleus sp. Afa-1]MCT8336587.1 glycosyltransferase family 4 protein [Methanoculleus sp. Afa-1]
MRLLVCTTEYFPHGAGIANVVYNVVQQLKERGIECTVCSPKGPDIRLGNWPLIEKAGVVGLLNYWYRVSRYFRDSDYDAVWLQNPFIIANNPFKRCLVTMHSTYSGSSDLGVGNLPFHLYESVVARIERSCLTRMPPTTLFTGVGQPVREELERIGIAQDRIFYIPNGVNVRQFHPSPDKKALRRRFGIPEEGLILLSVGRLIPAKQPFTLIEVFSHLEEQRGDLTLCIAGGGELLEAAKSLAERLGVRNVLFLGNVDHARDLPDLYACADYYIMTSKYEGGMPPLTLAEAMASGLPCIVSGIPNLGIVRDADAGTAIDFEDAERAGDEILRYLDERHSDHAANARRYAVERLDWEVLSGRYARTLEHLIACEP